ncbi:MAG: hypothetical protein IPM42_09680 [Saprospiraceae bacterium]|nr:hypothetical protein [Saprospiraceae bacterium]
MSDPFEHIDAYIQNQLPEADKEAFEAAMLQDDTLRSAVENYHLMKDLGMGFLEVEVREILNAEMPTPEKKIIHNKKIWAGIFILILFGIIIVFVILTRSEKNNPLLYADIYVEPNWPLHRGDQTSEISDAITTALSGNYMNAVQMLKLSDIEGSEKNYWIAEIFAKNAVADSVLVYINLTRDDSKLRDRINYLRIISFYQLKKYPEVKELLIALPPDTDEWYLKKYKPLQNYGLLK